jgi:TPR repeat protein
MFTEYCISGEKSDLSGIPLGVEKALDDKFIECSYERLADMWRSTGESRGDNPCFVDDEDEWEFEDQLTSARQGDMEAQFQVAESYYYGNGVDENEAESAKWYKKAALQGHVESMMKLGQLYYIGGDGVPENDAEAKRWYKMAADAGNREAKNELKKFD